MIGQMEDLPAAPVEDSAAGHRLVDPAQDRLRAYPARLVPSRRRQLGMLVRVED